MIKEWHRLDAPVKREDEEYLGARWSQDLQKHTITVDMDRYFGTIVPEEPPKKLKDEQELDAKQQQ